tara:strand:- start:41 stop:475 length:435 start_codon:yes stop_codon:yes gene_type:complete
MTKICKNCGIEKDLDKFKTVYRRYKRKRDGGTSVYENKRNWCRKCEHERLKVWRKDNPTKMKEHSLRKKYGINMNEYGQLLKEQNYECAICKSLEPKGKGAFHVDHCHETGRVRGLLCHNCNAGIGFLQDNPTILSKAIDYLKA